LGSITDEVVDVIHTWSQSVIAQNQGYKAARPGVSAIRMFCSVMGKSSPMLTALAKIRRATYTTYVTRSTNGHGSKPTAALLAP
jgi:hypothetical protein